MLLAHSIRRAASRPAARADRLPGFSEGRRQRAGRGQRRRGARDLRRYASACRAGCRDAFSAFKPVPERQVVTDRAAKTCPGNSQSPAQWQPVRRWKKDVPAQKTGRHRLQDVTGQNDRTVLKPGLLRDIGRARIAAADLKGALV